MVSHTYRSSSWQVTNTFEEVDKQLAIAFLVTVIDVDASITE
jgi:hypothetical protein